MAALHTSQLKSLPLLSRGKVRDIYAVGADKLLIVQSDRISAFDVVMDQAIPEKGAVLTEMSYFWFSKLRHIVENHLCDADPLSVVTDAEDKEQIKGRAMLVHRYQPLPIEAVCRGYLIGSGWKDYRANGSVCGINLPAGLRLAEKLPQTIFTPATKAVQGEHDENISFEQMAALIGEETAHQVKAVTLRLYEEAAVMAAGKGMIIADTKFEFAVDNGKLILIDEVLTPDSSRFWPADSWRAGENPQSFDKQYIRDWLETTDWDKTPPPPPLPDARIAETTKKYREIRDCLLSD